MSLHDAMMEVSIEKIARKGDKKYYISFTASEFDKLRVAFGRISLTPNDVKKVLLALADGTLDIVIAKKD